MPNSKLKIVAILCLTAIEIANILTVNYDGTVLMTITALISGLAGYEIGKGKSEKKDEAGM